MEASEVTTKEKKRKKLREKTGASNSNMEEACGVTTKEKKRKKKYKTEEPNCNVEETSGVKKRIRKKKKDKTGATSYCNMEEVKDDIHDHDNHPMPIFGVGDEHNNLANGVSVMALWEMRRPLKRLVEQQRLFAVYLQEGEQRKSAKITLDNKKLYLHSLEDEPKPVPYVYYLQYEEVLRLSVPLQSIFMDICARGSAVGRIHILLNGTAPPSLPLYCTGSKGPSYINKHSQILDRGTLLEQMLCGSPPTGTGLSLDTNLDQLFSLRNDPSPRWAGMCGSVVLLDDQTSPPLLAIRTGPFAIGYDAAMGGMYEHKIGVVSDGLTVVRDAIYCLQDVRDLTIGSCGVVLSTELPINESSPL